MLYCPKCKKEVIIYAISSFPGADEAAADMRKTAEKEGKLIIFNPPPRSSYTCPNFCMIKLVEKKGK